MSGLPDPRDYFPRPWEDSHGPGPLAEYLDRMCRPLAEVLPPPGIDEYRALALDHIREIAAEFEAEGLDPDHALRAALDEHGDAELVGSLLRDELARGEPAKGVSPRARRRAVGAAAWLAAAGVALAVALWFGVGETFCALALPLAMGGFAGAVSRAWYRSRRNAVSVAVGAYLLALYVALLVARHGADACGAFLLPAAFGFVVGVATARRALAAPARA